MRLQPSSQVQARPIDWLWLHRLAFGKLAILDGDPSLGKSFIALDLCARLSTGRPMPDGSPGPGVANSMYLFAEDGSADTVRPRLTRLAADHDRVFLPNLDDDDEGLWAFPTDLARLAQCIRDCDVRLVVIDPIMAFLDASINSASDQSLRRMLTPFKALAEKLRCAILFLRHLNKSLGMRALYRGAGSIAFSAACRFEWLVTELPGADKRCVLAQYPSNLTGPQHSLVYEVRRSADGEGDLLWDGVADWTAKQLLNERRPRRHPQRDRAVEFLKEILTDGPKTSRQIWAANETHGFSLKAFRAARNHLDIRFHKVWNGGDPLSYWMLPHQQPPPPPPPDPSTDLMPFFQDQLKRLPPASPLDEVA